MHFYINSKVQGKSVKHVDELNILFILGAVMASFGASDLLQL